MWCLQWLVCCVLATVLLLHSAAEISSQHVLKGVEIKKGDHASLFSLHKSLVEIESISGNEYDVGTYLHDYLAKHNFTVERQYAHTYPDDLDVLHGKRKSRFNLLAYLGKSRNTRVLVTSHIDTVPPFWPYAIRNNNEIWGRGSVDAKACVAAQIMAVSELRALGEIRSADVALLFVVGEEVGGDGMRTANDLDLQWETVIFGEPTELKLATGHKGLLAFILKAVGKAAHSGYPWLGESANSVLVRALYALDTMKLPSSEKYGNSTLNIGTINGGVAANVIAENAEAEVSIRIADGNPSKMKELILNTLNQVDDRLQITYRGQAYGPIYIDSDVEGRQFFPIKSCFTSLLCCSDICIVHSVLSVARLFYAFRKAAALNLYLLSHSQHRSNTILVQRVLPQNPGISILPRRFRMENRMRLRMLHYACFRCTIFTFGI